MTGLMWFFFLNSSLGMDIRIRISASVSKPSSPEGFHPQDIVVKPRFDNMDAGSVTMSNTVSLESLAADTRADPEEICRQIRDHVQYAADTQSEDEWRPSEETLKAGRGDCEDFAICVKDMCAKKGLQSDIRIISSKVTGKSHAIATGNDNGVLWISSNGSYERVDSIKEAKDKIAREMGWGLEDASISEVNDQNRKNTAQQAPNLTASVWFFAP